LRAGRDLLDGSGDLVDATVHVLDRAADSEEARPGLLDRRGALLSAASAGFDHLDRTARLLLDLLDQAADRGGGLLGLLSELADFLGDDGEPASLVTG